MVFTISFADVARRENIILEILLSLSGDYLKENGIHIEYTVEANSENYANYIHKLTGIPVKDIHYVNKSSKQDAIFYKNGIYILKDRLTDVPTNWRINVFDGENYFSYFNENKFGQITKTKPDLILPNYFDLLTKMPQSLNIPKYWGSYLDYFPSDPSKVLISYLPNDEIRITFKPDPNKKNNDILFDFYLKKQSNTYLLQEICLFSHEKSPENLLVRTILSNYKYVNEIQKYLPFEINVEYYTLEGELLFDGKSFHLDKVLERIDKIHVKKVSLPNLDSLKVEIPNDAVIHDFNLGKTIYLEKIFNNNRL